MDPVPRRLVSRTISCKRLVRRFGDVRSRFRPPSVFGWRFGYTNGLPRATSRRRSWWDCRCARFSVGEVGGGREIFPSTIEPGAAARRLFPPLDRALVRALACETVAQTGLPLSRQSLADLTGRAQKTLGKPIGRSTVWRWLQQDSLKPWQYQHWIFPRDPDFESKAGPILDLYAGQWEGKPLDDDDCVISSDEKTSIQARRRCHAELPPQPGQARRIETEYERKGALQYLAAWDVRRGMVVGRCEPATGIVPFGRLVDQLLTHEVYRAAKRLFLVVDNGSSHRGQTAVGRLQRRDRRIVLVHTPVHASWLNQVEVYFSIIQRKVLTPNDFDDLDAVRVRLALYEHLTNASPKPFAWKFTRNDLERWLQRANPHFTATAT